MTSTPSDDHPSPDAALPVLRAVIAESDIPDALRQALDAKATERAQFRALEDALLASIRPDIERLTGTLVRRSLSKAWTSRSKLDLNEN